MRNARAVFFHPLAQLFVVCGLLWMNQIAFGAYILRAHGGDTSFIARYISHSWFAIARNDSAVRFLAAHVGDGHVLAPSLLRVQAFLELPFTIFAYLAVARLLGRGVHRKLVRLPVLVAAAASFTVTFSIVELMVKNPYTSQDLVLRALAALLVPAYVAWTARMEDHVGAGDEEGPSGALGLLAFLAGAGAIAYVVLAAYDAFLLYNLAHLPAYATGGVLAVAIASVVSFVGPRVDAVLARACGVSATSASMDVCASALRAFTLFFFVPSLPLRYWGADPLAILVGVGVVLAALIFGVGPALLRASRRPRPGTALATLFVGGAIALACGFFAATAAVRLSGNLPMRELLLARFALSFLAVAIVTFRAVEIAVCWTLDETKAPVDEA